MPEYQRRRRRQRHDSEGGSAPSPADLAAMTTPVQDPEDELPTDDRETERGLRGLVGGGASQVGIRGAMRARDATRPTEADMADAEANLMIIRRGWKPPPTPR